MEILKFFGVSVDLTHIYLYDLFHRLNFKDNKMFVTTNINATRAIAKAIKNTLARLSPVLIKSYK